MFEVIESGWRPTGIVCVYLSNENELRLYIQTCFIQHICSQYSPPKYAHRPSAGFVTALFIGRVQIFRMGPRDPVGYAFLLTGTCRGPGRRPKHRNAVAIPSPDIIARRSPTRWARVRYVLTTPPRSPLRAAHASNRQRFSSKKQPAPRHPDHEYWRRLWTPPRIDRHPADPVGNARCRMRRCRALPRRIVRRHRRCGVPCFSLLSRRCDLRYVLLQDAVPKIEPCASPTAIRHHQ